MAHKRYTTTEKELLAIVKTLKEFKNILLGQDIKVYMDHKKLTYKTHNSARVMRWRLIFEAFFPELIYIPGQKNIVADTLSWLSTGESYKIAESAKEGYACAEMYALEKEDIMTYAEPLS